MPFYKIFGVCLQLRARYTAQWGRRETQSCPRGSQNLVREWMSQQPSRIWFVEGHVVSTGQGRAEQKGLSHKLWGTSGECAELGRLGGESGTGRSSVCYLPDMRGSPTLWKNFQKTSRAGPVWRSRLRKPRKLGSIQMGASYAPKLLWAPWALSCVPQGPCWGWEDPHRLRVMFSAKWSHRNRNGTWWSMAEHDGAWRNMMEHGGTWWTRMDHDGTW